MESTHSEAPTIKTIIVGGVAGGWRLYESATNERTVPEYICTECD